MAIRFEWNAAKAKQNLAKHKISFEEASTVFGDPLSLTISDISSSTEEHRFVTIGESNRGRLVVVIHTDRGERIRIISARAASKWEKRQYFEEV